MAPEHMKAADVDRRADTYSLGAVLYRLSTGQSPFSGDTILEVMNKVLYGQMRSPSEVNLSIPLGVERVILRAVARQPEQRFQTTKEMVEALHRTVNGGTQ